MLPRTLLELSTRTEGERIIPHYLTERDHPWLRALLDEYARFEGQRRSDLAARLTEPLVTPAPKAKLRVAIRVLDSLAPTRAASAIPPPEARWRVFRTAAKSADLSRAEILQNVATDVGVSSDDLESSLFADLRGERRVPRLPEGLSPTALASRANLALVSGLLRRAATLRIVVWGNSRALVRHARLVGLICTVEPLTAPAGAVLSVSGPLALFHHTEVYGRALASLVPRVLWCGQFELRAECALGRGRALSTFVLLPGDPIDAGDELRRHDSRLEERFARDFARAAPDWDVIREPRPIDASGALIFPDFELVHRHDTSRRWLLEIVGFWTADYLAEKFRRLKAARVEHLILCIDERRKCQDAEVPEGALLVRYRTKIDPRAVLAMIGG